MYQGVYFDSQPTYFHSDFNDDFFGRRKKKKAQEAKELEELSRVGIGNQNKIIDYTKYKQVDGGALNITDSDTFKTYLQNNSNAKLLQYNTENDTQTSTTQSEPVNIKPEKVNTSKPTEKTSQYLMYGISAFVSLVVIILISIHLSKKS